jgi:hypothetical protein
MVFTDWAEAKKAAEAADQSFIGFGKEGELPQGYVLVAKDATAIECRNAAFEAMRGRPIDPREELLLEVAGAYGAED